MSWTCSSDKKCIQNFNGKTSWKAVVWRTEKDNNETNIWKAGHQGGRCMKLTQDDVQWWVLALGTFNLQVLHRKRKAIQTLLTGRVTSSISYRILHGRCRVAYGRGTAPAAEDNSPGNSHIESNTCHYEFPPPVLRP